MNEWIKIFDKLPESGQRVLAFGIYNGKPEYEIRMCTYETWDYIERGGTKGESFSLVSSGCGCCDLPLEKVTHWQPLPNPPEPPK